VEAPDAPFAVYNKNKTCKTLKQVIDAAAGPTLAQCAKATKEKISCLGYFVAEDPPKSCNCCTGEATEVEPVIVDTKAARNVYKLQRSAAAT